MVEVFGADIPTPSFGGGFSSTALVVVASIVIVCIAVAIVIWYFYQRKIYNKKIVVFENISGQGFQPIYKDNARLISVGDGGEELMYLKKKKVQF